MTSENSPQHAVTPETRETDGKQTIIPFQRPAPRNPAGAGRLATLQEQIRDFQQMHSQLEDAYLHFRESLSVTAQECTAAISALQALRRKTRACLPFLTEYFPLAGMLATLDLEHLDGETTARLILELDAFRSVLACGKAGNRAQTRERIEWHVRLQHDLNGKVEDVGQLMAYLLEIPAKVQQSQQQHPSCR